MRVQVRKLIPYLSQNTERNLVALVRVLVLSVLATLLVNVQSSPANATTGIVISQPSSVVVNVNSTNSVTGFAVSGLAASDQYSVTVSMSNAPSGSSLRLDSGAATGITLAYGYSSSNYASFTTISFSGTATNVNSLLATLSYISGATAGNPTISVTASPYASADYAYSPETGHYYKSVSATGITWYAANAAAKASTFLGLSGYLVTITSSEEQSFVNTYTSASNIWIGATDSETEGTWKWDTGGGSPEAGKRFWQGVNSGSRVTADGLNYSNWCTGEPNNSTGGYVDGEDFAVTKWNGQTCWNDLAGTNSSQVNGYVIEYGTNVPGGGFTGAVAASISVKYSQTISITSTTIPQGQNFSLAASTPQTANPVSFRVIAPGTAGCAMVDSLTVSSTGVIGDTCTVTATVAGNTIYESATSASQILTIVAAIPTITLQPVGGTRIPGENFSLSVAASVPSGTLSYQWRKNGSTISGETGTSLTLSNVSNSDSATYTVLVTNTESGTSSSRLSSIAILNVIDTTGFGAPTLSAITRTSSGFSVQITNYNSLYSYESTTVSSGSRSISASGLVTVSGLSFGTTATLDVKVRLSTLESSTSISGTPLLGAPTFGTPTRTQGGFTVQVTNYSGAITYESFTATASGSASINGSGLITVTGLADSTTSVVTFTLTAGSDSLTATVSGTSAAPIPTFGAVVANSSGYTVRITNYSGSYTWETVTVSAGSASIDGTGLLTVTGLTSGQSSTVGVRMSSGGSSTTNSITGSALTAAATCPSTACVFTNGRLRFGNGNENSINGAGNFQQPWYYSASLNSYRPLTFSSYPLNLVIGTGTGGSNWTGSNPVNVSGTAFGGINMTDIRIDYSRFVVTESTTSVAKGYGVITVRGTFTVNSNQILVEHTYSLGQNDGYVKTVTTFTNLMGSAVPNTRVWVGTQDDWIGNTDGPTKDRGNLTGAGGAFVRLTSASDVAQALKITSGSEGVLFYSTTPGANTVIGPRYGYTNMLQNSPSASPITSTGDQTYAAVFDFGNLAAGSAKTVTWFYAGGSLAQLEAITQAVAGAAAAAPAPPTLVRGNGTITVNWNTPQSDDPITNYTLRYSTDNGSTWTTLTRTAPDTSTSWTSLSGLDNSLTYLFQVAAISTSGGTNTQGNWSGSSDAYVLGSPPTSPTITSARVFGAGAALDFTPASSPAAAITNYEYRISNSDTWTAFSPPITESVSAVSGALISSLPAGGSYAIQLRARNSFGAGPADISTPVVTLPIFTDTSVATMTVGTAFSDQVSALSSVETFTITSGSLPEGLTLDARTGRITGTPTIGTSYSFTVTAQNSAGSVSASFSGTLNYPANVPTWRASTLPAITNGSAITIPTLADSATTYSLIGTLPLGLSFNETTGAISGTPTVSGSYDFVIRATNSYGYRSQRFTGTVQPPASIPYNGPVFPSVPTLNLIQGAPSSSSVAAAGGTSYTIIGGALPAGLTLNPLTGLITGTPTQSGPYSFVVLASNSGGSVAVTISGVIQAAQAPATPTNSNESKSPVASLDPIPLPAAPAAGNLQVLVDGKPFVAKIVPNSNKTGLEVQAGDWNLQLAAKNSRGEVLPLGTNNEIVFEKDHAVDVSGTGFAPNSEIKTYLFSNPILIGTAKTDASGGFKASFSLPKDMPIGAHTLQVNGLSSKNEVRSASVGIFIKDITNNSSASTNTNTSSSNGAKVQRIVVSFAFNKYNISKDQLAKLKRLVIQKGASVRVFGYAQKTDGMYDIAVSLDRALELKKAIQKINPNIKITTLGMGHKYQKLCIAFKNKCAVATITVK